MEKETSRPRAPGKSGSPKSFEDYLAAVPKDARAALESLRTIIKAAAPGAEELISYQIPTFRYRGRPLVAFAAFKNHCSFFPMGSSAMEAHKADLEAYDTSKGTIRFTVDKPLPAALIRKLVKARIEQNEQRMRRA